MLQLTQHQVWCAVVGGVVKFEGQVMQTLTDVADTQNSCVAAQSEE